jgi:hypothetical protein
MIFVIAVLTSAKVGEIMADLDYLTHSEVAIKSLAEQYVGLPLD